MGKMYSIVIGSEVNAPDGWFFRYFEGEKRIRSSRICIKIPPTWRTSGALKINREGN